MLFTVEKNNETAIIQKGIISSLSPIKYCDNGFARSANNIEKKEPIIALSVKAVLMKTDDTFFFCITAEPRPALEISVSIAVIAVITANIPKTSFVRSLDINEK